MQVHQRSWETKAKAKVAETNSKIPNEWRLSQSSLDQAKQMKKLSGPFIESFLNDEELVIIRNDSTLLVERVKTGGYTALQVAQAFCKTAAIAHQIVSIASHYHVAPTFIICLLSSYYFPSTRLSLTLPHIEQLPSRNLLRAGIAPSKGVGRVL